MPIKIILSTEEAGNGPSKIFETEASKGGMRIYKFILNSEALKDLGDPQEIKRLLGKSDGWVIIQVKHAEIGGVEIVKDEDSVDVNCWVDEKYVTWSHPLPIPFNRTILLRIGELDLFIRVKRISEEERDEE